MTYYELFLDAVHKLNFNKITIGEYEKMIEPLKREINQQLCEDWKFYYTHGYAQAKKDLFCEDCISRQATIDALWKALYEYENKTEKQFIDSEELDIADWFQHRVFVQNMSDIDRKTILNMPPVTPPQTRFIPVSERMPEKTDSI